MIRDIELRFVEQGGSRVLQWRKLIKQGPGNNWAWEWTEWADVPLEARH